MRTTLKVIIIILLAGILVLGYFYFQFKPSPSPQFGLSFSITHAQYLGFDWKTLYLDMLNDLKPKKLRLMSYWELIEPQQGQFHFQEIDEMLIEAGKRGIDVILVVGQKQPRWPECHHPSWYEGLDSGAKDLAQLKMMEKTIAHFKDFEAVKIWQVENEPFFAFGPDCPRLSADLVKKEIELVKSLDQRPILLTDSGEQGYWVTTASLGADVFGSTMYRTVYSPKFGYYKYPLPPQYFRIKAGWLKKNTGISKIIGVELQAEPWFTDDVEKTTLETQYALMNPKVFEANVEYAKVVGFDENYLWGVEWWYWLAKKHDNWGMWEEAKRLLASDR